MRSARAFGLFVTLSLAAACSGSPSGSGQAATPPPTLPPTAAAGGYSLTLKNTSSLSRPDAGNYQGTDPLECNFLSDQWHAFFENAPPYAGQVSEIIVQSGPYAYVHARTVNGTGDLGNWQVTQGASDGVVTVNVTDNGSNSVSFVVHGTDDYQDIAMNFDCSKVQRL